MQTLDNLRGKFDEQKTGYTVWNIVNIWKETRPNLGTADLSRLNLLKTGLQYEFCYYRKDCRYNSACFDNSIIADKFFLPQGHNSSVSSLAFHPKGKTMISGSWDNTIKVWDLNTGKCLATMTSLPGILLAGCSFRNLHPDSQLSAEAKNIMRQYGVIFDENDEKRWNEAIHRAFPEG